MAPKPADSNRRHNSVCVVDDDTGVCASLSAVLEVYGHAVLTYATGAAFLAGQDHRRVDILIIDQHMPQMAGLEVVAELHRQSLNIPTVLLTGKLDAGITERANELGVMAVLEKPFSVSKLVDLVRVATEQGP